jgi:UTP--glucose-1-phosphate uridylyltransferase
MPEKITTAVIAAAGSATRMWPASKVYPKELFPLGRVPVIVHLVWELIDAGIEEVILVTAGRAGAAMQALFDPSVAAPGKIADDPLVQRFQETLGRRVVTIMEQSGPYGNATPLRDAADRVGNRACVYAFGDDVVIGENATQGLMRIYERTGNPVMGAQEVAEKRKSSFGILECERDGDVDYVKRILEKPKPGDTPSNLASFGRYVVTPAVLDILRCTKVGHDNELWFVDAVSGYMHEGGKVCAHTLTSGNWYTVGDPQSYADAVKAATDEQDG